MELLVLGGFLFLASEETNEDAQVEKTSIRNSSTTPLFPGFCQSHRIDTIGFSDVSRFLEREC